MNLDQVYLFSSLTSIPVDQRGFLDGASNVSIALFYTHLKVVIYCEMSKISKVRDVGKLDPIAHFGPS